MRRFVEIIDWGATAVGTMMAINLSVVALILSFYVEEAPRYRGELPLLLISALLFGMFGAAGCAGAIGLRRQTTWGWPAQGVIVGCAVLLAWFIADFLRA